MLARIKAIEEARKSLPAVTAPPEVASQKTEPQARGSMIEAEVYRRDSAGGERHSFFADLTNSSRGDTSARERLHHNNDQRITESRDLSTAATAGGGFIPPVYLGELYAGGTRAGRPFADALGSQPLSPTGMTVTLPRITTDPTAAVQAAEADAVSETDMVEGVVSTPVRTIAGQQDVSTQLLERSDPGIDQVLFRELTDAYDTALDNQLLNGNGSGGQHDGIMSVAGSNDITWTDGSPTAAECLGQMYDALQRIHSNRFRAGDMWILHPRRSAWLASELSSTFPLFQQAGNIGDNAVGSQNAGQLVTSQGIKIVNDANVVITNGAGSNEDAIFAIRTDDLILQENPVVFRVFADALSGTLQVRLQAYAYSAFISNRYPAGISNITGTGLVAPTF